MPGFSIWHLLIIAALVLVVFGGGGKLSQLMGDAGKGMKAFKDGLKDEDEKNEAKKVDKGPDA